MSSERMGHEQDGAPALPSASPVVRLELAILAADLAAAAPTGEDAPSGTMSTKAGAHPADLSPATSPRSVLVLTADILVSHYIAQCLNARTDVRVVIAEPATAQLSQLDAQPALLVVDVAHIDALGLLADVPAILVADEQPEIPAHVTQQRSAPVVLQLRPFNARTMLEQVDVLLGGDPAAP